MKGKRESKIQPNGGEGNLGEFISLLDFAGNESALPSHWQFLSLLPSGEPIRSSLWQPPRTCMGKTFPHQHLLAMAPKP